MNLNGAYYLFNKGVYEIVGTQNNWLSLPSISKSDADKFEQLGMKVKKVKYNKYSDTYRVYDPNVEEYEEITLPLRAYAGAKEIDCRKNHKEIYPNKKMIEAAEKKYSEVADKVKNNDLVQRFEDATIDKISAYIQLYGDEAETLAKQGEYGVELINYRTLEYFVIKKANIVPDACLQLKVSKNDMGLVIGRQGENLKKICKKYNLKYIQVISKN